MTLFFSQSKNPTLIPAHHLYDTFTFLRDLQKLKHMRLGHENGNSCGTCGRTEG